MLHTFKESRLHAVTFVSRRGQYQFVHQLGMPDRDLQRRGATVAETHKIGFLDMELLEQGSHIIGILLEAQRTVDIRSVPVSLQLYSDHLMSFCQIRQDAAE